MFQNILNNIFVGHSSAFLSLSFSLSLVKLFLLLFRLLRPLWPVDVVAARGNGDASVVQRRTLQDDAGRASDAGQREDPQEEPVQHHRHEFPVLDDLRNETRTRGAVRTRINSNGERKVNPPTHRMMNNIKRDVLMGISYFNFATIYFFGGK